MSENVYPKELYKDNLYRVVWGPEEQAALARKGWSDEPQEGIGYVVHTAEVEAEKSSKKKRTAAE